MIRRLAIVVGVALIVACGDASQSSTERCRELDETFGPADAWDDIAELQEVAQEWVALGCADLIDGG